MSRNNAQPPLIIKLLAFMAGVIVVFSGAYLKNLLQETPENPPSPSPTQTNNTPEPISDEVKNRISFGDKIFYQNNLLSEYIKIQDTASLKMKEKQYNEAYNSLNNLRDEYKTTGSNECANPETLIYKNNALIGNSEAYTIAVVVPIENSADRALEMLRGVAQAQEEINYEPQNINGKKLRVIIANEKDNDRQSTEIIADTLGRTEDILGVVGHLSSDATEVAAPIYRNYKLVSISPTSTKVNIAANNQYFFRIAHDNQAEARALANYMLRTLQQRKASILFNNSSVFSRSLSDEFAKAVVKDNRGQIYKKYDLDDNSLKGSTILSESNQNDVSVFMFATSSRYLQDIAIKIYNPGFQKFYYLGGDATYNPKLLTEDVGERLRKIVIAIPWHHTFNSKESKKFVNDSYKLWCQPKNSEDKIIWRTATAYDATKLLIEALKDNPSREGVKNSLSKLKNNFSYDQGVTGKIKFKPNGDRAGESKLVQMVSDQNSPEKYVFKCIQGCEGK